MDSADIHPQNYGGDFQVELAAPLLFDERDPWEVALAEMTYDAQGFPNIPPEYSEVKLEALNRDNVYDAMEMDLSITAFLQIRKKVWHESDSEKIRERDRISKYVLPKKYYTWEGFKDAVKALGKPKYRQYFTYGAALTDTQLEIKFSTSVHSVKFEFSRDLINFLTLEKESIESAFHHVEYLNGTVSINYKKPTLKTDHSAIIFPTDTTHNNWIEIRGHGRFNIPNTNYTIHQLSSNFQALLKDKVYDRICRFSFDYIETDENYQWELKIEAFTALDIALHFSYGFLYHLGAAVDDRWAYLSTKSAAPPFVVRRGIVPKVKKQNLFYYTNFPHNFYPGPQAFCDGLNSTTMDLAGVYMDAKSLEQPLFTMEKVVSLDTIGSTTTGKCVFKPHPFFNITLHPFILKMLNLENTTKEHTGTSIVLMPSATREFFYLYTNIISSHTYSGAINMLRVINNNTALPNEKIMISFPHFYYHPITQLHISNIHIRITDSHTDLVLPFQREVTCLLHFRRCSSNNHLI